MKTALLDTSFLVDLSDEAAAGVVGPASRTLAGLRWHRLFISPVTAAEVLEGADLPEEAAKELGRFHRQTIGWQAAQRCALNQSRAARRMGENDAWQAALAAVSGHRLVGSDAAFSGRPGLDYLDHRAG
jgi:predicted nucleic acid-binding protein